MTHEQDQLMLFMGTNKDLFSTVSFIEHSSLPVTEEALE